MIKYKIAPYFFAVLFTCFIAGNLFSQGEITPHLAPLIKPGTILVYKADKLGESGPGFLMVKIVDTENGLAYQVSGKNGKSFDPVELSENQLKTATSSTTLYAKAQQIKEGNLIGLRMSDYQYDNYMKGLTYSAAGNMEGKETAFRYNRMGDYDIMINNSVYRFPVFRFFNADPKEEDRSRVSFISQKNFPLVAADYFHKQFLVAIYTDGFAKRYGTDQKCVQERHAKDKLSNIATLNGEADGIEKYVNEKKKVPTTDSRYADVAVTIHYMVDAEGKVRNILPEKTEHLNSAEKIINKNWVYKCMENAMWTVSNLPTLEAPVTKNGEKTCVYQSVRIEYIK